MKNIDVEQTIWRIVADAKELAAVDYESLRGAIKELLAIEFELQQVVLENQQARVS